MVSDTDEVLTGILDDLRDFDRIHYFEYNTDMSVQFGES